MLEAIAREVTNFIHANPHWGSIITFFVAFAESLAVIGTIVPGSITMTAIGVMVGTAVLPLTSTFFWATTGALAGDYLGYWIGKNYSTQIRASKWLQRKRHWIEKGEEFFRKHGGKSVIIGRFFGPVRSLIPMIAGLLKMSTLRFTIAVFPAAFLWAVVYMTPGILLGALSLELPPSIATKFLFYGFAIILFFWLFTHMIRLFLNTILLWCDGWVLKLWVNMRKRKSMRWFTNILADPKDPNNHQQLALFFLMILFGILFLSVCASVVDNKLLTYFNEPIVHLLTSIRTPALDKIMIWITLFAERKVMLGFGLVILVYLAWQKKYRAALHWIMLMVVGVGVTLGIKHAFYHPRPNVLLSGLSSSSFPSGHVALMTLLLGFTAVLVSHELPIEQKRIPYRVTAIAILLITLSRLYLGAHWLTDTLAAFTLAITVILMVTISYRRHLIKHISPYQLITVAASSLLIFTLSFGLFNFNALLKNYQPPSKTFEMSAKAWWKNSANAIPLYRNNRLGKPIEILNIQWMGDVEMIKRHLVKYGWQSIAPSTSIKNLTRRAAVSQNGYKLSLLPQQFHNAVPALLLIKDNLVLRLWQSNVMLTDSEESLWLGSMRTLHHHHKQSEQLTDIATLKKMINPDQLTIKGDDIADDMSLPENLKPIRKILKLREEKS